jgi:hypothetical protein
MNIYFDISGQEEKVFKLLESMEFVYHKGRWGDEERKTAREMLYWKNWPIIMIKTPTKYIFGYMKFPPLNSFENNFVFDNKDIKDIKLLKEKLKECIKLGI